MAVTRSTIRDRATNPQRPTLTPRAGRAVERLLLVLTAILVVCALAVTAAARLARVSEAQPAPLNLSEVDRREQLLPFLQTVASPTERQYIAGKIFLHLPA